MTSATLWLEITIAGFIYVLAIFFFCLRLLGIYNLAFLSEYKDFLPYISVGLVALSYIFGILAHRLIQIFGRSVRYLIKNVFNSKNPPEKYDPIPFYRNLVKVYQYGSERLHREIDFQYGLVALFRSLMFSIPLLGTTFSFWLIGANLIQFTIWVIGFTVLITIFFIITYRKQYRKFMAIQDLSFEQVQEPSNK